MTRASSTEPLLCALLYLLTLLVKYEASGNAKALALFKKISPAAWRHVHLNGHYRFRGTGSLIDLDAIVAGLDLG